MTEEHHSSISQDNMDQTARSDKEARVSSSHYTRWVAGMVLFVAIPLLLMSISALAVFYATPERFDSIVSRFPGEAAIRTVLIFAPVTLLAIVVLAILYAVEKPSLEVTRPQLTRPLDVARYAGTWMDRLNVQHLAWWTLLLSSVVLLILTPIRAAAFLSPTRFENFLGRYPGEHLLNFVVHSGPIMFLVVEILAGFVFVVARIKGIGGEREILMPGMRWMRKVGSTRLAVGIVLALSVPILVVSLTSLVLFFVRTESFLGLIDRLPGEVPLRMGLIFIPASLILVVALALLFLLKQKSGGEVSSLEAESDARQAGMGWELVLWYLSWIFTWVIAVVGAAVIGLVVGVVVLILR
jgi:hypothetical protein